MKLSKVRELLDARVCAGQDQIEDMEVKRPAAAT